MKKQKTKKSVKKIIITALIALTVFVNFGFLIMEAYAETPAPSTSTGSTAGTSPAPGAGTTPATPTAPATTPENSGGALEGPPIEAAGNATVDETKKDAATVTPSTTTKSTLDEEFLKRTASFIIQVTNFLNTLLWPVLVLIGWLMDNSLLFGSGMEERLREIWIPIRNIVNILFVIGLVGIAIYNILGIGGDENNYSIKAMLPKIIIGIIAVNFSFFGIKVFLDAINILTTSVFMLPGQINEELQLVTNAGDKKSIDTIRRFCEMLKQKDTKGKITGEVKISDAQIEEEAETIMYQKLASDYFLGEDRNAIGGMSKEEIIKTIEEKYGDEKTNFNMQIKTLIEGKICTPENTLTPRGEAFLQRWDSRNAALAMALNMTNIVFYRDIDPSVDNADKLAINAIFSMMMYLIYVASFIALFVVLLARMVVLWLAIALSPILVLGLTIPLVKEKLSGFGEVETQFVKNAIAPLGIALAMTVGWIMLRAIQSVNMLDNESVIAFDPTNIIPVAGISTLQDLMVALGTVAVVWLGIFTAASNSIAAPVTEAIKGALKKAGTFVGTMPLKHMPFVPIKLNGEEKAEGATLSEIGYAFDRLTDDTDKRGKLWERIEGKKEIDSDWINTGEAKTKKDAVNYLHTKMKDIKERNRRVLEEIDKAVKHKPELFTPEMERQLKIIVEGKEDEKVKEALQKLEKLVAGGEILKQGATSKGDDGKQGEGETGITGDTKLDGKTLKKINDNDEGRTNAAVTAVDAQVKTVIKAVTEGENNPNIIEKIRSIKSGANTVSSVDELKKLMKDEEYKKLEEKLGGEDKVKEIFNTPSTPSPAAGSATPPAGTPPA